MEFRRVAQWGRASTYFHFALYTQLQISGIVPKSSPLSFLPNLPPTSKALFTPNPVLSYIKNMHLRNTNQKHIFSSGHGNTVEQKKHSTGNQKTSILVLSLRSYVTRRRHLISNKSQVSHG